MGASVDDGEDPLRTINFDALPTLDDATMGGAFLSNPRKKTVVDGRTYLLKVEGAKSRRQVVVDRLKPVFDLPPMGVEEVYDNRYRQPGCLIPWFDHVARLSKVSESTWTTPANVVRLIKIAVYDGVIANNDRTLTNVLLLHDGSVLPIDEGECERAPLTRWVKYRRSVRALMALSLAGPWFEEWLAAVRWRFLNDAQIHAMVHYQSPFVRMRFMELPRIVAAMVAQVERL